MWKKMMILSILCVFGLAIVSIAEERMPVTEELHRRFDYNRDVLIDRSEQKSLQKFDEIRARIEKLRSMAREAEEKSKRFQAEAEELERVLKHEFGRREMAGRMEEMHAQLAELKEAVERAKREGQHDKAAQLHEKARIMAAEIMAHERQAGDKKLAEAEERIVQLYEMAREAKERGEMDKAERLGAEAKELKVLLKREVERREMAGRMGEMHAQLAELKEAAEQAKREGQHDKAAQLREKAEQLAGKITETAHRGKDQDIKKEIEHLHALARKEKEAGHPEKAEAILQEAKNLERHFRDAAEGEKEMAHKKDLEYLVEKLRDEVNRLREEVERHKHSR